VAIFLAGIRDLAASTLSANSGNSLNSV